MRLTRIVRMVFKPEFIPDFQAFFTEKSALIRSFPGCEKLELWQDEKFKNVFYTHSQWKSKNSLEVYRSSDLFKGVWHVTKQGFADRPQAWSTYVTMDISPAL